MTREESASTAPSIRRVISNSRTSILVNGCIFNRDGSGSFVTNNIRMDPGGNTTIKLSALGCGFAGFNSYVPSSGTPYVAVNAGGSTNYEFIDFGNTYASSIEAPNVVGPSTSKKAIA
jgi:hypothetical protein